MFNLSASLLEGPVGHPSEEETSDEEEEIELPEGYNGPYKMVFVVNSELKMGVGKIAAQVYMIIS